MWQGIVRVIEKHTQSENDDVGSVSWKFID